MAPVLLMLIIRFCELSHILYIYTYTHTQPFSHSFYCLPPTNQRTQASNLKCKENGSPKYKHHYQLLIDGLPYFHVFSHIN